MKSVFKKLIPQPLMPAVTHAIYFPKDALELVFGHRDALTPPTRLLTIDGSRDAVEFKENGERFLGYFKELCDLSPQDAVLDVGCGVGRKAVPLAHYLDSNTIYEGFDIVQEGIDWCHKRISARYPNFHFQLADVFNKRYNPQGKYQASEYRFPFFDESFDFAVLASVFTHMLPEDVENYFSEISRVLKQEGRCFITFFLCNAESSELNNTKRCSLDFRYEMENYRTVNTNTPEDAVCYDETFILDLYEKCGFRVDGPIRYGSWCGRREYYSYQDIIVATKSKRVRHKSPAKRF